MADETKVTPGEETIAPVPVEGTVDAEIAKVAPEAKKESETVPLSVYLALKDDVKDLKKEIKESKESKKPAVTIEGVKELAKKYPDVSEDFIADILSSATSRAKVEIDEKYSPLIEEQSKKEKQQAFDTAFDKVFTKALGDNPDLPADKIDKDVVKALALTPAYKSTPIADIVLKLYGNLVTGKSTTENEARASADRVTDTVDFKKMNPDQKDKVLENPETRKKYFEWMDKNQL